MPAPLRLCGFIAGALLLAAPARADPLPPDLTDDVPGHPGVTFEDLLKQAAPDLHDQGSDVVGHVRAPLRHLAGHDFEGDLADPQTFSMPEAQRFEAGGRRYLAILVDLGGMEDQVASATLLALYDDGPRPKLLDTVGVGLDRLTGFSEHPIVKLGPHDQGLVTYSEHFNSDETFSGRLIAFVRGGKWRLLDSFFSYSARFCGWERDEVPVFTSRPDPGRAYWQVSVDVQVKTTIDRTEGCDERLPRPGVVHHRAVYRWDARRGRFVTSSKALKQLFKSDSQG